MIEIGDYKFDNKRNPIKYVQKYFEGHWDEVKWVKCVYSIYVYFLDPNEPCNEPCLKIVFPDEKSRDKAFNKIKL